MRNTIAVLAVAVVAACRTAEQTRFTNGDPDGGTVQADAGTPDPSCITPLFRCWDIRGECAWSADREWMGEEVGALCYASGACQLGPLADNSHIALASDGHVCFREYDPAATGACEIGHCTYRYDGPDGVYVVRESRDVHGAVVLAATCPGVGDPKPIPERAFYRPIQWQEDALNACVRSLRGM